MDTFLHITICTLNCWLDSCHQSTVALKLWQHHQIRISSQHSFTVLQFQLEQRPAHMPSFLLKRFLGAAIQYQRIQCQHIQSQRFAIFHCYLFTIYCRYEQLLYILLSKKTNISKMTSDSLGSKQQFISNQTRGVGTECVGTKFVGTKQLYVLL